MILRPYIRGYMGVYVGVKQDIGLPRVKMEEKLEIAKNQGHYGAYLGVK